MEWYKLYDNPLNVEDLIKKIEEARPANDERNHIPVLRGEEVNFYDFIIEDKELWEVFNSVHPLQEILNRGGGTEENIKYGMSVWEWDPARYLIPHTDRSTTGGNMVVPLVGEVTTRAHRTHEPSEMSQFFTDEEAGPVTDEFTYGPGQIMVIDNSELIHSVVPHCDYRLALCLYLKDGI